jgi:hypothetical protein
MSKRIPKKMIGRRLSITWVDPTGGIGAELNEMDLAECVSEGKLVKLDKKKLVLQSSIYTGTQCGDFTCLAVSLITDWREI